MAKIESSIRRARSALAVLAASACLQWPATPAQAQEGLCGLVPEGGIDDINGVIANLVGSPGDPFAFPPIPPIPSVSEDMLELYLAELIQEWGIGLGSGPYCSKASQNFVKVCQTVVKSSVKCIEHQIDGLAKQDEEGCKAFAGSEAKACEASVDEAAETYLGTLTGPQTLEEKKCATVAGGHFFRMCKFGTP